MANARFGAPQRFGAMTKDGKGEAVGGITLMLKGANTSKVIKDVQQRMEEVKKILPKGLKIHAYLDRSGFIAVKVLAELPENARIVIKGSYYIKSAKLIME